MFGRDIVLTGCWCCVMNAMRFGTSMCTPLGNFTCRTIASWSKWQLPRPALIHYLEHDNMTEREDGIDGRHSHSIHDIPRVSSW